MGIAVSSPSRVRGGAPAAIEFCAIFWIFSLKIWHQVAIIFIILPRPQKYMGMQCLPLPLIKSAYGQAAAALRQNCSNWWITITTALLCEFLWPMRENYSVHTARKVTRSNCHNETQLCSFYPSLKQTAILKFFEERELMILFVYWDYIQLSRTVVHFIMYC